MSTLKKPRGDSPLKNLPPARQAEIYEHLSSHTLAATEKWLADDGFKTSSAALSYFRTWWQAVLRDQKVNAWLECEKLEHPELSEEELFRRGQRKFSLISIAEEDPEAWVKIQRTQRDKDAITLDKDKFEEMKRKAKQSDEAKEVIESAMTPDEQRRRLKEILK